MSSEARTGTEESILSCMRVVGEPISVFFAPLVAGTDSDETTVRFDGGLVASS